MTPTIQDAHIRQQALDPTQSFIVQAPAGSGKTELLTQRYLVLLSHAEKAPEEIIAITFTRKSAAEMRVRILHALEYGKEPEPDKNNYRHITWQLANNVLKKDHALNWNLIQNPNRLRILTIDALSAFLCRQTPMLTNFGGSPSVCENASALYELAATRLLIHITENKEWQPHLDYLLLHLDNNVSNLESLFSDLLNHRDQWLPHIMYCYTHKNILRDMLESSLKRIRKEKIVAASKSIPNQAKQIIIMLARHAGDYFEKNNAEHPIAACANFIVEEKPALSSFSLWSGLANLLLTQTGEWRKSIDIRNGFGPKDPNKTLMLALLTELQEHPNFKASLNDILIAPPADYSESQWEAIKALTQLLPLLSAQLNLVFQEKGQIDFVELNAAALKALGNDEAPTDLALYLDYQIRHLLIDEFQDTSVTHLHLLEKITAGWEPNDGRTLFLVGDPMQSIYRFRNAEVGLFLRAQQQGLGNIFLTPLTLSMNFRSQGNLVNWFNNTFSTVFPAISDITTGRVPYTHAIAAKSPDDNAVHFYPIITDNDQAEAELLISKIILTQEKNITESIAILVRSRAQLIPIINLLHENKLLFQAIDIEPLSNRAEIQDLLSLTRALLHRADRIAWLAVLRSPFCGVTLSDLESIANFPETKTIYEALIQCEKNTALSNDGLIRLKKLKICLQHAFNSQYQLSLSQWIEGVWIGLGGPACLLNPDELNNTRSFFDLLSKLENESPIIAIEQLIQQCEKLYANARNSEKNVIQILTIHKSKGLEFDHVFIPGLQRQTPPDRQKLFRWLDRPNELGGDDLIIAPVKSITHQSDSVYDYLKFVEKGKQDNEITRLLYVAATRAKKSLHVFSLLESSDALPKQGSFLHKLWPVFESHCTSLPITTARKTDIASTEKLLLSRLPSEFKLLSHATELSEQAAVNIDINLHSKTARIVGTVIHEALQKIAEGNKNAFSSLQCQSRLFSLGVLQNEIADCIDTVNTAIEKTMADARGQWILSSDHTDAKCELALTHVIDSEIQHVIIDRAFVDENKTRWIIDYKTAQAKENESMIVFLERQKSEYRNQLDNYASIIAARESNPIKLGLYFPLCGKWIEWDYKI
ncbi:MAG: UvrD-helicase domain-containing protein [Gammaproteobacteria bacterium]|nr:UvrD-helicase domain-containing protein [Gammaproteobacteria bacterium]